MWHAAKAPRCLTRVGRRTEPHSNRESRRKRNPPKTTTWRTEGDPARLLALDPSSVAVGWAYFEAGSLKNYGRFLQIGREHGERLLNFHAWLTDLFTELNPTTVTFEAPFQGRHRNAFGVLSMYKGAILSAHFDVFGNELADRNRLPAHIVKRAMGLPKGTHEQNKKAGVEWVNKRHKLTLRYIHEDTKKTRSQDDIADAIAVGDVWHALHGSSGGADG